MSYVDTNLMAGEHIRYRGHISLWSLTPSMTFAALLLLGSAIVYGYPAIGLDAQVSLMVSAALGALGLLMLLSQVIKFYTTEIAVTNVRVMGKVGFVRRISIEMLLDKIESLQVEQSMIGRWFDFGTVTLSAAGAENARLNSVSEPFELRQMYYQAHNEHQKRRDNDVARASQQAEQLA